MVSKQGWSPSKASTVTAQHRKQRAPCRRPTRLGRHQLAVCGVPLVPQGGDDRLRHDQADGAAKAAPCRKQHGPRRQRARAQQGKGGVERCDAHAPDGKQAEVEEREECKAAGVVAQGLDGAAGES